jgi:hypothetical protein
MHLEEICLSTTEADSDVDHPLEASDKVAVLQQANWMRRCRSEFTLFNNHHLSVETQRFMQDTCTYTLDIGMLDPHPKRVFKISWRYFLVFFVLCGAGLFFALSNLALNATLLSISLVAFAVTSLVLAIYRSHDQIVFYSQYGRTPLVVLFNKSPDRVTLDSFTDALVEHIKDAKGHNRVANEILNKELKEHRRLMEEGVISSKRYDIVKQLILSQHS